MIIGMAVTASASKEPANSEISADEFFAAEYRFEQYPYHPEDRNAYVFRYSEEHIQRGITGYTEGYLYRTNFEKIYQPEYTKLIYPEKITVFSPVKGLLYVSSGKEIFSIDYNGENKQTILETDGTVTHIQANDVLIYYVVDDVLYRYFIPEQQLDCIGDVPGIEQMVPYSNQRIYWCALNPDWSVEAESTLYDDDLENDIPHYFEYIIDANIKDRRANVQKMDMTPAEEEEYIMSLPYFSSSNPEDTGSTFESRAYSNINGKTIPSKEYPNGSYFTTDGKPCVSHNKCINYVTKDKIHQAKQCFGFGFYVHEYIWGENPFPDRDYSAAVTFSNKADVEAFFVSGVARRGSIFRVRGDGHTLAFIGWSRPDELVYIWDANCNVRTYNYSFNSFATTMKNINYMFY